MYWLSLLSSSSQPLHQLMVTSEYNPIQTQFDAVITLFPIHYSWHTYCINKKRTIYDRRSMSVHYQSMIDDSNNCLDR